MSVDTLNADLATLRGYIGADYWRGVIAAHETDATPPPCSCADNAEEADAALARVEAELSRLREERDAAETRRYEEHILVSTHSAIVGNLNREKEAAEARCARLQQALRWMADYKMTGSERTLHIDFQGKAREALAGPDTPADSQPEDSA